MRRRLCMLGSSRKYTYTYPASISGATAAVTASYFMQSNRSTNTNARSEGNEIDEAKKPAPSSWKELWETAAEESPFLKGINAALPESVTSMMNTSSSKSKKDITAILARLRDRSESETEQGVVEDESTASSLWETLLLLDRYRDELAAIVKKYTTGFGDISNQLVAPAFFYYLEEEDSIKNPSWKRRMHRFCRGVKALEMDELNDALELAELSYADSRQEIMDSLADQGYEVLYCGTKSEAGKPAHFLAVKVADGKPQVVLVIRGTKTVADTITDLICDATDYRGGKAHSFILESGKYIAEKHLDTLQNLAKELGSPIEISIVGHSLGAGAAAIAGMELNDNANIEANVVGFGAPALLSKELAESTAPFVMTIVNDDDVVPRMSGATVANLLLKVSEFDWVPYAQNDIDFAIEQHDFGDTVMIKDLVAKNATSLVEALRPPPNDNDNVGNVLDVELFPPGKCIHFYRDGVGLSGCVVPNTFFAEIDVSRTMLSDHLFESGYRKTLLEVERQRTGDHHFSFGSEKKSA